MGENSHFLLPLCIVSAVLYFHLAPTAAGDIISLDYEEPGSKSYFDELSQFSNYNLQDFNGLDEDTSRKTIPYADLHHIFQEVLHAFSGNPTAESPDIRMSKILSLTKKLEAMELEEKRLNVFPSVSPCINDTRKLLTSLTLGHSWAIQFFDASGKPGPSVSKGWLNFVGHFDQCRAARSNFNMTSASHQVKGGYFTVPITLRSKSARSLSITAKFGICFPSTCSSKQVRLLFKELLSAASLTHLRVGLTIDHNAEITVSAATVIAIIILVVTGSLAIVGTVYDVIYVRRIRLFPEFEDNPKNSSVNSSIEYESVVTIAKEADNGCEEKPFLPKTVPVDTGPTSTGKVLLAFSLYTNGRNLLNTSQSSESLGSIHGIRFLSMAWVVLGHCYAFGIVNYSLNFATEYPMFLHRQTFDAVANALLSVDTFFTLSGLLTSYTTLQALWRQRLRINWPMFYFHRFWRLTPPYMFAIVIFLGLQQYLGQGPFWSSTQPTDRELCEKNWWTNLLYINNLVKSKEMCFEHSWYLANDMQFFVISPIMLIPFYFHWAAGVTSCLCVLLASWITTGVLSYQNDWGTGVLSFVFEKDSWFFSYYIKPWCRIGPYVIGILAGYALAKSKGKPIRFRRWVAVAGWLVAFGSALALVYGIHGDIDYSHLHKSTRSAAALYNTVGRTVWGACVCWVVVACAAGYGGPINTLLSWSPFVVLGRLSYMTYLLHLNIIHIFFSGMGSLYYLNDTIMPIFFMGLLLFCNMAAFVGVLLLESPTIGLEKLLLKKVKI